MQDDPWGQLAQGKSQMKGCSALVQAAFSCCILILPVLKMVLTLWNFVALALSVLSTNCAIFPRLWWSHLQLELVVFLYQVHSAFKLHEM